MWRHKCAGGLKKKLYLRSWSQRHRHFTGFFNVPVLHRHGTTLFMPPDRMIGGILFLSCLFVCLFACLSVCLSVVNFNLRYNFWAVRDKDFIFGMHTPLMTPLKWHQGQWPCDLDIDLEAKNRFLDFVAAGGILHVSQTHLDIFIRWFRHTAPFSHLLRHTGDMEDVYILNLNTPAPSRGNLYLEVDPTVKELLIVVIYMCFQLESLVAYLRTFVDI